MKKAKEVYLSILQNKIAIALLCVIPFLFMNKNLFSELYLEAFVVFFASFVTEKRFTKKECLQFALLYLTFFFILEAGALIYGLTNSAFGFITLIFYGITILLSMGVKIILWFVVGGLVFYLVNLITIKTVTKFEKVFLPVRKLFTNPLNVVLCGVTIFILLFIYNGIFVNVKSLSLPISSGYVGKIALGNEKLLLFSSDENKLAIFDFKNNEFNTNCPQLKQKPDGFNADFISINFKKMPNGNIFIRRFFVKNDDKKQRKTIAYVYSPLENKIVYEEEIPEKIAFYQTAIAFLDNKKVFCVGADNDEKTYIYDIQDKILTETAETKQPRRGCELLPLNNGKVLIWGGYSDDCKSAELYDIKNNEVIEIQTNFNLYFAFGKDKLNILDDGTVLIKTTKLEENEADGIGTHFSGISGTGYPIPYFVKFNPKDNSFDGFVPDKNQRKQFYRYNSVVTQNGKIIIAGATLVNRKSKHLSGYSKKVYVYDIKSGKLRQTYMYNFPETMDATIFTINDKEFVLHYSPILGNKKTVKNPDKKLKFYNI